MRTLALLIFLLAGSAAQAQQQPVVRVQVSPESVGVGEAAELTVTVLVPTWFTRPPVYPTFELANAITRLPADSSFSMRERVGNESWSGIVRTYEIYPLLGARYRIAGQSMTVTFANPGSAPTSVEVNVPEVTLRGVVPQGAESLEPYVAGRKLTLALEVEGQLDELEAGDAIVLTYRAELDGLPAIFLPPLAPALDYEGVSTYRDLPDVQDGAVASRSERVTLVFDAGGEFRIPGFELRFWNTETRSIETAVADGLVISVQGSPVASIIADGQVGTAWERLAAGAVVLVLLLTILWRVLPALLRRHRENAERRRQSEAYAFGQLAKALGSGNGRAAYHALVIWLERLEPRMGVSMFATRFGNAELVGALTALSAAVYRDTEVVADFRRLTRGLATARKRCLEQRGTTAALALPPLNP
jgi:hypothetical protein